MRATDLTLLDMQEIVFDVDAWKETLDGATATLGGFFEAWAEKIAETIQGVQYRTASGYPFIEFPDLDGNPGGAGLYVSYSETSELLREVLRVGKIDAGAVSSSVGVSYNAGSGSGLIKNSTTGVMVIRYWKYADFYAIAAFDALGSTSLKPVVIFSNFYDVEEKTEVFVPFAWGYYYKDWSLVEKGYTYNKDQIPVGRKYDNILYAEQLNFDGKLYSPIFGICYPTYHTSIPTVRVSSGFKDMWNKGGEMSIDGKTYKTMCYTYDKDPITLLVCTG